MLYRKTMEALSQCGLGAATVILAMGGGKRAAAAIHQDLSGSSS